MWKQLPVPPPPALPHPDPEPQTTPLLKLLVLDSPPDPYILQLESLRGTPLLREEVVSLDPQPK